MPSRAYPKNGKYHFHIAGRDPWTLPTDVVQLPSPPEMPSAPSPVNLLTMLLPSVIMITGSLVSALVMDTGRLMVMIPTMLMGLGYPVANLLANKGQKKKYEKSLKERKKAYIGALREYRSQIEGLIEQQRTIMNQEFPNLEQTIAIGMARGENKRLWWRRPNGFDFLNLRCGTGVQAISFTIEPPKAFTQKDPLNDLPFELLDHYHQINGMPFLVDLKRLGSLVVFGPSFPAIIRLVRRMLAEVLVHHSPEDVSLFVLASRKNAVEEWEWLKWAPHVHLLDGQGQQNLLFTADKINLFLDDLKRIFFERMEVRKNYHGDDTRNFGQAYVVVFDDDGVRSHDDVRRIAEEGWQVGIYFIFITEFNVPSTYRARIEVDASGILEYQEQIETISAGNRQRGEAEFARKSDVEPLARTLAGLEVAGGKSSAVLPSTVRVVDLINGDPYSVQEVVERWRNRPEDSTQMLLPVGQYVDRDGLAMFEIDFRPESIGGKGAYHAMMIGTTGSGKSIFMQSLVLAAAHRYSPRELNFMFMDFKAGAAELKKVSELPHSVGMVTDLSPILADRALQALENELSRRKLIFDGAGKITDIWDYNRRFSTESIPHLIVMIDEFAEGIKTLPNLVERLKELGRQGRAFGIYFFLANQEVNSAVDMLKANVSWYVLLKVNRQEEMNLIERRLPVPPGRGRGYVKVKSDITSLQSAYAGLPANAGRQEEAERDEYVITTFGPDGRRNELYRFDPRRSGSQDGEIQSELELLMSVIKESADTLNIPPAQPIYTEPLPAIVRLCDVIRQQETFRLFNGESWLHRGGEKNVVPLGYLDIPNLCTQPPFSLNFNESGGHLWVMGTPGSGKNLVLLSLASVLCLTHSPKEVNLYVLEFGNGQMAVLDSFPHTAAVIRAHEVERLDRLLNFLQEEMRLRTETDWRLEDKPEIYFFINNVADFRIQYPDQADELGRFVRSGGSVGIHVILSSNRGSELPHSLSGNITNRIVLQLTDPQEFYDVLPFRMSPLTMRTQGRGYLCLEGEVEECQIAIVEKSLECHHQTKDNAEEGEDLNLEGLKDNLVAGMPQVVLRLGAEMRSVWKEELPKPIKAMEPVLALDAFKQSVLETASPVAGISLPLGLSFQRLAPVYLDVRREGQFWTVIGGRQSGKSTCLLGIIHFLMERYRNKTHFTVLPFRRGPLAQVAPNHHIRLVLNLEKMPEVIAKFAEEVKAEDDVLHVLILDDAGIAYSMANSVLIKALDSLGDQLNLTAQDNYMIVIADLYSNLKSPQSYSSTFMKLFQQSQAGIFFSMDDADMQWFNTRIGLQARKSLKWLPGRGFWVSKGEAEFIQSPLVMPEDII